MHAVVHAADIQDRDGGMLVMSTLFGMFPFLLKLYADAGYQGPQFQQAMRRVLRQVNVEIVKRSDVGKFVVLPQTLDRGKDYRLAQPVPPAGKGLGMSQPKRHRLPAMGLYPHHAPKTVSNLNMIPDRL